jgi:hypothetical protein
MLPLVNARGVPGALGAVVRTAAGERGFVTCQHVLFGGGAGPGDRVWAMDDGPRGRAFAEIGRTVAGWIGRVTHAGETCFVDCAVGVLHDDARLPPFVVRALADAAAVGAAASAEAGGRVRKAAWVTGVTEGVVADTDHYERPYVHGRSVDAPRQLRVRPLDARLCFSAPGESGAAVLDEAGRVVGFLWGTTPQGEGIACPAAAALEQLGVVLDTGDGERTQPGSAR